MKTFGASGKRTWNEDPLAFQSILYRNFKSNVLRRISLSLLSVPQVAISIISAQLSPFPSLNVVCFLFIDDF